MSYIKAGNKYVKISGKYIGVPTTSYMNVLNDGNTVGWYRIDASLTTMEFADTPGAVSKWKDYLGSERDLPQTIAGYQPYYYSQGVLFEWESAAQYLQGGFTLNQPVSVYMVLREPTYTHPRYIFDGSILDTGGLQELKIGNDMYYQLYSGSVLQAQNYSLILNRWGILRVVINGASSKIQVDNAAPFTGDAGSLNLGGFTVGAGGGYNNNPSNIQVKEIILRKVADSATNDALIYNYLADKYGLVEPSTLLRDGNTWAWYRFDASVTMSDASIIKWADCLGSGHDLDASGAVASAWSPKWSTSEGIVFDGVNDYMKTATSTLAQPTFVYMVFTLNTYADTKRIFDGYSDFSSCFYCDAPSPRLSLYAGGAGMENGDYVATEKSIVRILLSGASSKIIVDNHTASTGNPGTDSMSGLTLGTSGTYREDMCADMTVKEIIIRKVADNATNETTIYNYLKNKHGL